MERASTGCNRIAFFGGSFDPPHLGHIAVARAAQQALGLDRVLFAPVGLQPLKPAGSSASFEDRVAMTRLAIAGQDGFEVSLLDTPNPATTAFGNEPNYTFDTLIRLREEQSADTCLFLLVGADSFRTVQHWYRASEILFLASLIVAGRPGEDLSQPSDCLPPGIELEPVPNQLNHFVVTNSAGDRSELVILPDLNYDISATQLRAQVQGADCCEPQVLDPAVLAYIREHRLY